MTKLEWLDKKGHRHPVAECPCWKCHVFTLAGLVSGGRLGEIDVKDDYGYK